MRPIGRVPLPIRVGEDRSPPADVGSSLDARRAEIIRRLSTFNGPIIQGRFGWVFVGDGYIWNSWTSSPSWRGCTVYGFDPATARQQFPDRALVPPIETAPQAVSKTDRNRAEDALAVGDYAAAIDWYQRALADTPDPDAARGLALALVLHARVRDGASVMLDAYKQDPSLASKPLAITLPTGKLNQATQRAAREANRASSASAWLAAAVFAQAERRKEPALRMASNAKNAGLESTIADRLLESLEQSIRSTP